MTSKTKLMIAAAAMTGLLSGTAARSFAGTVDAPTAQKSVVTKKVVAKDAGKLAEDTKDKGKHDCKGKNECKGQGGCKTGDDGCKGKNTCKGKGGCNTMETTTKPAIA
jgi:hypothetical protein